MCGLAGSEKIVLKGQKRHTFWGGFVGGGGIS